MKAIFFLLSIILIFSVLGLSNLLTIVEHPIQTVVNIALITMTILLFVLYIERQNREKYDYDQENPHALVSGGLIAGTVYSDNLECTPGLGWIV